MAGEQPEEAGRGTHGHLRACPRPAGNGLFFRRIMRTTSALWEAEMDKEPSEYRYKEVGFSSARKKTAQKRREGAPEGGTDRGP